MLEELAEQGADLGPARRARAGRGPHDRRARRARRAYERLGEVDGAPRSSSTTYFDHVGDAFRVLPSCRSTVSVSTSPRGEQQPSTLRRARAGPRDKTLFAGVVDGRNVWINDLDHALELLERPARPRRRASSFSTSCSLQHSRSTSAEPPRRSTTRCLRWMAFAVQKLDEVATLARRPPRARDASRRARRQRTAPEDREDSPRTRNPGGARPPRDSPTPTRAAEPVRRARRTRSARASAAAASRRRRSDPSRRRPRFAARAAAGSGEIHSPTSRSGCTARSSG